MALTLTASDASIVKVIKKLKESNAISPNACFQHKFCHSLRKEVLFNDLDFKYFLAKRNMGNIANKDLYENALSDMKKAGAVAEDAFINYLSPNKLRETVSYRDFDFLYYLGEISEVEITDSAIQLLKQNGIIEKNKKIEDLAFKQLRSEVKRKFKVPWTSFSPAMERLTYMLASAKKPKRILGVGVFCGNTFVWSIGPILYEKQKYDYEKIYAIDIDDSAIKATSENYSLLNFNNHVNLMVEDGLIAADMIKDTFDYIYLDADSKEIGKGIYFGLVKKLYNKLEKGGWLLAHDTNDPIFKVQVKEYLEFVRDKKYFTESISFDIDLYGLELSIK